MPFSAEHPARTYAESPETRARFLVEASTLLASSLDYETTLASVAQLAVPQFADWCIVYIIKEDQSIQHLALAHVDPAKVAWARQLSQRYPPDSDAADGVARVLRLGKAELHAEILDSELQRLARDPEHLRMLRNLGVRSVMLVPLVARGRTLGAIAFIAAESGCQYRPEDLTLAEQLAAQAALAVDNSRLYQEAFAAVRAAEEALHQREGALTLHRQAEEQLTLLVEASRSLTTSLELPAVLTAILDLSRRMVAADAYAVWRRQPGQCNWHAVLAAGLSAEYLRTSGQVADSEQDILEVPVIARNVQESTFLADRREAYRREGIVSLLAVPIRIRDQLSGTLTFYYRQPHEFGNEVRIATALANLAASSIASAELFEEERQARAEAVAAEKYLAVLAEALQQADRRKDEFLALLGHELRNPLGPLRNALEILRLKCSSDPVVEPLRAMMERQLGHMSRLVDDLLDMSRITRGKIELRRETLDLATVITLVVETCRPFLQDRQHEFTLSVPKRPIYIHADATRLEQVLANLLNNAAKYTEPGGHIWLTAELEPEVVRIRVRDTGIGIRPEMLEGIFELFTQADRPPNQAVEGLGIGLTLVRSLVELHGGSVQAHSAGPGQGSEFVVRLPLALEESVWEPATPVNGTTGVSGGLRVLAVDDNVDAVKSLALLLELEGHEVRIAHDGQTALDLAVAYRPNAAILDIGLPHGMDGYEVARRLRRDCGLEKACLIALTGYGQEEDRRRAAEAGFDYHLTKPVDPQQLQHLLTQRVAAARP
jgi:signal transduction histidine kinase/ActR/RegA family two-component response regulator